MAQEENKKTDHTVISENFTPEVLRNSGVPIKLRVTNKFTDKDGGPIWKADPDGARTEKSVAFTTWHLHLIEEHYGSLNNFVVALNQKRFTVTIVALGVLFDWPHKRVAESLIPNYIQNYVQAIYTAYEVAMGYDPKGSWEALMATIDPAMAEKLRQKEKGSSETTTESSGPSSGPSGSNSEETQTSSGGSPLVSSLES